MSNGSNACLQDPLAEIRAVCAKGADDVDGLARALVDPDVRVAVEAARSLIRLKATFSFEGHRPQVLLAIAQAGGHVEDLGCRSMSGLDVPAACLPAQLRASKAEPATLVKFLKHRDERVQMAALEVLGESNSFEV